MGVPVPRYNLNGSPVRLQGRSLLPFLNGPPAPARTRPHVQAQTAADMRAAAAEARAARTAVPPLPAVYDAVHASHQWHEMQMYYPMRVVVASDAGVSSAPTFTYKLIYNIAAAALYPIAGDLWDAPSFQDLLNRTAAGEATHWYRNFSDYVAAPRPRWQLFDLLADPAELQDRAGDAAYAAVLATLQADIKQWQTVTHDDWLSKWAHER